jgi:CRISPR-associated protein Cas2
MFDLPVKTKIDRRNYARFRKKLLGEGFSQLQYSVYARPYVTDEASRACRSLLTREMPSAGHIRFLFVTDRQFEKMECYLGKKRTNAESMPEQFLLF